MEWKDGMDMYRIYCGIRPARLAWKLPGRPSGRPIFCLPESQMHISQKVLRIRPSNIAQKKEKRKEKKEKGEEKKKRKKIMKLSRKRILDVLEARRVYILFS